MCAIPNILVDLSSWQQQEETFHFCLDDAWFATLDNTAVDGGHVDVEALLRRVGAHWLLSMNVTGRVTLPCDRCLQPLTLSVESDNTMDVRLADAGEEDDHLLLVDARQPVIDLSWLAYEQVVLTLPLRRVHEEGECTGEAAARWQQINEEEDTPTDPRWDKLKTIES